MNKKLIVCFIAAALMGLMTGCSLIGYDVQERETPSAVITAPPDTSQPQETFEPEQTPSATPAQSPTPSPTPTPEPIDLPTFIAQHLGSVPDLILTGSVSTGTAGADETFAVALEEDISTGYLWQWEMGDSEVTDVLDTRYQPESEEADVPGTHIWAFKIGEPGEYTLDFTLVAPDGGVGNVQSMTVTVE